MKTLAEINEAKNLLIKETSYDGGMGYLYKNGKPWATVIWSDGGGWDHVSISPLSRSTVPSWDDMCKLKNMFFNDDECVVEYHPAKSDYVNIKENCLHLWKPQNEKMPTPPLNFV